MTVGRTSDLTLLILGESDRPVVVEMTGWLGASISGETVTTQEAFYGQRWEHASVHAAGESTAFSTVYDTAAFDTVLNTLGISEENPLVEANLLWVATKTPVSWHLQPVGLSIPGLESPSVDSVTRPWAARVRGRVLTGTRAAKFGPTTDGTNLDLDISSLDGTSEDDAVIVLIITAVTGTITSVTLTGVTSARESVGWAVYDDDAAAADMSIQSDGGTIEGYVLVGTRSELPSG
ncbi:MAG: hypothetical protein OXM88_09295 [bacterium]|nr:hypothetical protein [bacterium]